MKRKSFFAIRFVFAYCLKLTTINIPNSVLAVNDEAFQSTGIITIALPIHLAVINTQVFYHCQQLEQINIPSGVQTICESSFENCKKLNDIILPRSLTEIGPSAFSHCDAIKEITIPKHINIIAENTFYYCTNLEKVEIYGNLTSIGNLAFYGCNKLHQIKYYGRTNPTCDDDHLTSLTNLPYVEVLYKYQYETFAGLQIKRMPRPSLFLLHPHSRIHVFY